MDAFAVAFGQAYIIFFCRDERGLIFGSEQEKTFDILILIFVVICVRHLFDNLSAVAAQAIKELIGTANTRKSIKLAFGRRRGRCEIGRDDDVSFKLLSEVVIDFKFW